jgi:hypothetical protein
MKNRPFSEHALIYSLANYPLVVIIRSDAISEKANKKEEKNKNNNLAII